MDERSARKVAVNKIVEIALDSSLIDQRATLPDIIKKFGGIEEVAGYVAAWDRYVLVVSANFSEPEILIRQPGR
ncbi:MAG TPA: hypothetical protein VLB76_27695 [Thermoanaerobaculia bacterium]|jgi:hypothetical protein|nr:hypothetical protein [Thermoanaerobaculia bacterium]